jgi:aldehyde:ferredoxin oxidoreductase
VGKAAVYCDWEDRLTIMDCALYCRFYRDLLPWPFLTDVVNAAIGSDHREEDLHRIANRIITLTHEFNAARGIGRGSETLPWWVGERPMEGEKPHVLPQSELAIMTADYYRIRGWE